MNTEYGKSVSMKFDTQNISISSPFDDLTFSFRSGFLVYTFYSNGLKLIMSSVGWTLNHFSRTQKHQILSSVFTVYKAMHIWCFDWILRWKKGKNNEQNNTSNLDAFISTLFQWIAFISLHTSVCIRVCD